MKKIILPLAICHLIFLNVVTSFGQAGTNDLCENAIPLTVGSEDDCDINGQMVSMEFNGLELVPSCYEQVVADAYYTFVVPPSGNVGLKLSGGVAIYDACNGNELHCDRISARGVITNLPAGETVILQYSQRNAANTEICLMESPLTPINDLCVNATPICGEILSVSNEHAGTSSLEPSSDCGSYKRQTLWFTFEAKNANPIYVDVNISDCERGSGFLHPHILSLSDCRGPFTVEDCRLARVGLSPTLGLKEPIPGQTYYIYMQASNSGSQNACNFDFHISQDEYYDFLVSPTCQIGDNDNFYVDVTINDLGNNPSGYRVNDGIFPDITTAGTFTVGPFANGEATLLFEGLDVTSCMIRRLVDFSCNCEPLAVTTSDDISICEGESTKINAVSEEIITNNFLGSYSVSSSVPGSCTVIPTSAPTPVYLEDFDSAGPIPFGFDFSFWENTYSDFYINTNGYISFEQPWPAALSSCPIPSRILIPHNFIALFMVYLAPQYGGSIFYFNEVINGVDCMVVEYSNLRHDFVTLGSSGTITGQIIMCEDGSIAINCIDCQVDKTYFDDATSGIENEDGTAAAFGPNLNYGRYKENGSYTACTTFIPDMSESINCDFLYWVTDLNNPTGSKVSSDATTNVLPSTSTTYYAIVECDDNKQCIDEVTITIDSETSFKEETISLCNNANYTLPNDSVVSTAGVYTAVLADEQGCERITETTIIIDEAFQVTQNQSICEGSTFILPDGMEVSTTGVYETLLSSSFNCDSIVTTNLTVSPSSFIKESINLCENTN